MRNPIRVIQHWVANDGHERSPQWHKVRDGFLKEHPACAACGSTKDVAVHHKLPFHLYPESELQESNLITLCETIFTEHHLKVGHLGNFKKYNPNVVADSAKMLQDKSNNGGAA